MTGSLWGIAWVGMLTVLLVVFVRQLRRSDTKRSWQPVVIGVGAGLAVAGLALLMRLG